MVGLLHAEHILTQHVLIVYTTGILAFAVLIDKRISYEI